MDVKELIIYVNDVTQSIQRRCKLDIPQNIILTWDNHNINPEQKLSIYLFYYRYYKYKYRRRLYLRVACCEWMTIDSFFVGTKFSGRNPIMMMEWVSEEWVSQSFLSKKHSILWSVCIVCTSTIRRRANKGIFFCLAPPIDRYPVRSFVLNSKLAIINHHILPIKRKLSFRLNHHHRTSIRLLLPS